MALHQSAAEEEARTGQLEAEQCVFMTSGALREWVVPVQVIVFGGFSPAPLLLVPPLKRAASGPRVSWLLLSVLL